MSSEINGQSSSSDLLLQIHKVGSSSSLAAQRLANFMVHQMGMANHIAATAASRWYLLLEIMPQIFVTLAVRFVLADCIGLEIFDVDTVSAFSNSAIFVIAIMLSGVLEDYKESEGFPAEIASHLDTISEKIEYAALILQRSKDKERFESENSDEVEDSTAEGREDQAMVSQRREEKLALGKDVYAEDLSLDTVALHKELLSLVDNIFEFLGGLRDDTDIIVALTTHAKFFALAIQEAGAEGVEVSDILGPFEEMRATMLRLHVIKRTDFIPSGFSLMELLVWVTMALTCLAQFEDNLITAYFTLIMSALQFFYVIALLRDIDDPFDYEPETLMPSAIIDDPDEEVAEGEQPKKIVSMQGVGASAEIDIFPLMDVYARIARLAGIPMGRPAPPKLRDPKTGLISLPSKVLSLRGMLLDKKAQEEREEFAAELRSKMKIAFDEVDGISSSEVGISSSSEGENLIVHDKEQNKSTLRKR